MYMYVCVCMSVCVYVCVCGGGGDTYMYMYIPKLYMYIIYYCIMCIHMLLTTTSLTCLTGSGTLFTEQATTSSTAVFRDILCPTDTYTGLAAASDVRTAYTCIVKEYSTHAYALNYGMHM